MLLQTSLKRYSNANLANALFARHGFAEPVLQRFTVRLLFFFNAFGSHFVFNCFNDLVCG